MIFDRFSCTCDDATRCFSTILHDTGKLTTIFVSQFVEDGQQEAKVNPNERNLRKN